MIPDRVINKLQADPLDYCKELFGCDIEEVKKESFTIIEHKTQNERDTKEAFFRFKKRHKEITYY